MSSAKWWQFCCDLNVLNKQHNTANATHLDATDTMILLAHNKPMNLDPSYTNMDLQDGYKSVLSTPAG